MQTNRTESIAWRVGSLAGFAAVAGLGLLSMGGCSPQSAAATAAGAVAADAARAVAAATTQPTAAPSAASAVSGTVQLTLSAQAIIGRWVIQKPAAFPDGTPVPDAISVIVFNKDGSYETSSQVGYGPLMYTRGTYQAAGNLLTTHLGKSSSNMTFRIQGSELVLVNKATKLSQVYHRG